MKKQINLIILILLFTCCSGKRQQNSTNFQHEIKLETRTSEGFDASKSMNFVKYIALETTTESLIKHVEKMFLTDSSIIIFDERQNEVFLFKQDGKFVRKFGRKGVGPGEHTVFDDVFFDRNTGYLFAHEAIKRIMYTYDSSGKLIKETSTRNIWFRSFCKAQTGYWVYTGMKNENTPYSLLKVDEDFNIIKGFFPQAIFFSTTIHSTFIQDKKDIYFSFPYNGGIYQVDNDTISPSFHINFGNRAIPSEKLNTFSNETEYRRSVENKDYLGYLADFLFYGNSLFFTFSTVAKESTQYMVCYDIKKKKVTVYDKYYEYKNDKCPFQHITLMQPQGVIGDEIIFLINPAYLHEKDMQFLQNENKRPIDTESNPILFFLRE